MMKEFFRSLTQLVERNMKRPFDMLKLALPLSPDVQKKNPVPGVDFSRHLVG
jgi:hypothetical protein